MLIYVYHSGADREIPRYQRRGAIIVLGMFALAKREIVTERTDTLLKVGLGSLGKVGGEGSLFSYLILWFGTN